jgi:UDP:flavonoid glycosyltransferase YjiC (YdhE family)
MKFILFPLGALLAHVGRLVEIGEVLRARGHDVVFAGNLAHPRTRLHFAQQRGFRVVQAPEADHSYAWKRFIRYGWTITAWDLLRHQKWAPLDAILEGQVELIRTEKPDMVVGDGSISVSNAAYIAGIPAAGVMNAYVTRFLGPTSIFMPMIYAWNRLHLERLRGRIYRRHGKRRVDAFRLVRSVPLISPDLAELHPSPPGWPNWHTVGPIISEPVSPLPDWYDELDDGRENIYISMGSTAVLDQVLRRTYSALGKMKYRFLLTTGGQTSDETLAMAPANFRIAKYAPGGRLAAKSTCLIFHGGNGTMYQGLTHGLPMLALPTTLEQAINADVCVARGFALKMRPRRVKGEALAANLRLLLANGRYREAARSYIDPVRNARGAERAADILEETAREGKPAGAGL